jgi:hypothetical protein
MKIFDQVSQTTVLILFEDFSIKNRESLHSSNESGLRSGNTNIEFRLQISYHV